MKLFANLFNITSTKKGQYPGDNSGDSIIATGEAQASKGETAQVYGQAGFISIPAKDVKGIRFRIGSLDIIIGAFNYKVPLPTNPGDSKVYSTDADGNEKATCKFLNDGTIEINGNADNAVAYTDLKTAFDQLKSDFDGLVTIFNAHTHPFVGVGPGNPGTTAVTLTLDTPSTADMSGAKVDTVRVP